MSVSGMNRRSIIQFAVVIVISVSMSRIGEARAAEPLDMVPADVCGVIVFPRVDSMLKKHDALGRSIDPAYDPFELEDFESSLNLEPGTIDPSRPVVLVLLRPEFRLAGMVVCFVPKDADAFREQAGGERGFTRRYEGPENDAFIAMRQGVGFLGPTRRSLRMARAAASTVMLSDCLNRRQQAMLAEGDLVVHLPLLRWREEKLTPMFSLATNLIKLATASRQAPSGMAGAMAVLDYLFAGARIVLEEMESATFALSMDSRTLRLSHYHTFRKAGRTREFLSQVGRSDADLLSQAPDVPFMFLMTSNWTNLKLPSLSARFCDHVCTTGPVVDALPPELRDQYARVSRECYDQSVGYYTMISLTDEPASRMRLLGGFAMKDAQKGLQQMRFLQENVHETLSTLLPGPGTCGRYAERRAEGFSFLEMPVINDRMSRDIREQTEALFGARALMQQAAADQNHLVYCLSEPPFGIASVLKMRSEGRTLRKNPAIHDLVERLPPKPHGLVIVDVGRAVSGVMTISAMSTLGQPAPAASTVGSTITGTAESGPLLGWALEVEEGALAGQLAMDAGEVSRLIKTLRSIPRTFHTEHTVIKVRTTPAVPPAPAPPEPTPPERKKRRP